MAISAGQFVTDFPEFADTDDYPVSLINFYAALADKLLSPCRWGDLLCFGQELFIAHNLALEAQDARTAAFGGIPGTNSGGPVASKAVDKVSVSYDVASASEDGAGHWNLTTYGKRYIRLARMVGAGGVQL